jgi:hypothetical protein
MSKIDPENQTNTQANPDRPPTRKLYRKPTVQAIVINSKTDVMGVNCFTSSQTSQQPGNGCNQFPAICFS